MTDTLRIALAQQDFLVGDVPGNAARIQALLEGVRSRGDADLVVFPELALCGYPPEDLLLHAGLRQQVARGFEAVVSASAGTAAIVGYPEYADGCIYNSAALIADGRIVGNYRKRILPNYAVFDEQRYFRAGEGPVVIDFRGCRLGLAICEDLWVAGPAADARAAGAELIVAPNGSPFETRKQERRETLMARRAADNGIPVVYVNLVGAQDELVFDGSSCVIDAAGRTVLRAPAFEPAVPVMGFSRNAGGWTPVPGEVTPIGDEVASIYAALITGVRDYVRKNGFNGVVIGLSGGVDSALTLAIAVDALGADAVQAVMMPYRYTLAISLEDAEAQARTMGVEYRVIPIGPMVEAARTALEPLFAGLPADTTEENIQSRCRGMLLMAISNKSGRLVLATGNKSEMAVGYATLYGDMAGGFAPIRDCTKTLVYALSRYRNSVGPVIPERVITRPPSAELAPDQLDSDTLPPYEILDPILDALILENRSVDEITRRGISGRPLDPQVVERVLEMVRRSEYKRRQGAPGVRISGRAFGRDWRYPITSGYRHRRL